MFSKNYENRLQEWAEFRAGLEYSKDPIQDVIDLYNQAPTVNLHTDPYDDTTWPTPWELLSENEYCKFSRVLGMCYSLQLTDRFNGKKFQIHIGVDNEKSTTNYFLLVDDTVLGYDESTYFHKNKLPTNLVTQKKYTMPQWQ